MKKFKNYLVSAMCGFFMCLSTVVLGFAASPEISNDSIMAKQYDNVWDAVENCACEEDLDILSEYMDEELLMRAEGEGEDIPSILAVYCSYDSSFEEILKDYF